jgi:hypothetical protein
MPENARLKILPVDTGGNINKAVAPIESGIQLSIPSNDKSLLSLEQSFSEPCHGNRTYIARHAPSTTPDLISGNVSQYEGWANPDKRSSPRLVSSISSHRFIWSKAIIQLSPQFSTSCVS